jgi:hypothetical protein
MSRFRTLLAWLIMAAIPLQGVAAASMLFCGMGSHHAPSQQASLMKQAPVQVADKATGEHDHATHSHAAAEQVKKTADTSGVKLPDALHKCGVCASCCHSIAIAEFPALVAFAPAPQADLVEPFVLIQARPSPVPDKPPRA